MTNSTNRTLSARISMFTTSLALAVGGLSSSPDVLALQKGIAEKAPVVTKSMVEMRREAALRDAKTSCESLLGSLNESVGILDRLIEMGIDEQNAMVLDLATNEVNVESIRQIEQKFDQFLTNMRLTGYEIPSEVMKLRKMIALARFKAVHLVTTVRHLQGAYSTFEGQANLEGLSQVAIASTESLNSRLH